MRRLLGSCAVLVLFMSADMQAQSCADPSPPTVSLSMSGPNAQGQATATIDYSFPPWVSARSVSLWFDGAQIMFTRPGTSSGTITVHVDTSCWRTGNHLFEAEAVSCNKFGEAGYFTRSGITSIFGSTDPQLTSFTLTELDTLGHSTATIAYNFPNTSGSSQRAISLWHEGVQLFFTHPSEQSGTVSVPLNTACWRTGTHAVEAELTACSNFDDPDYAANQIVTIERSTKPELTMSITGPDSAGQATAEIDYSFPNTDTAGKRAVSLWIDGVQTHYIEPPTQSDHWSIPIDMSCWTSGTHRIEAEATACELWDDPDYSVTQGQDVAIGPEEGQFVRVTPLRGEIDSASGRRKINLQVDYGFSPFAANRRVTLDLPRWTYADGATEPGTVLFSTTPSTSTGTIHFTLIPGKDAQQITFRATAESCAGQATDEVAFDCGSCDGATSNPVYFTDGNMRLSDSDALPSIGAWTLNRTYNSDEQVVALFGRGWTTLFDRRLIVNGNVVSMVTETNEVVTFRKTGGVFVQRWPKARRETGTLTYDGASGTYTHRGPGSSKAAVFDASTGRLLVLRDLSSGREAQVGYNAQGLPQSLTDSWSGTSWLLTYESGQRRVGSVSVAGLVWTYLYDGNGNLTTVKIGSDTWRTYVYSANRMTESHDALGHLIESHAYDANGYATSSTGNVDEIATIQYNLASSNPGERVTRVTEKNGAVTDYVLVASGSAWRTARVIGGCGSCGTRDKSFVRDLQGRVIREQSADGYISTFTYAGDHLVSDQQFLKPSGCDPETDTDHCRLDSAALAGAVLEPTSASVTTSYAYNDTNWPERATSATVPSIVSSGQSRVTTIEYHSVSGRVRRTHTSGWTGPEPSQTDQATATLFYGDALSGGDDGNAADPFAPAFDPGGTFQSAWLALAQPARLTKSIDGLRIDAEDLTSFVYYPINPSVPATSRGRLAASKNAAGHITRFESYDVFGNALRVVDSNGVATEMTYDALGRLKTSTVKGIAGCDTTVDPLCATDLTTTRAYSPAAGPLASERQPSGGITVYAYESRGRVQTISRGPSSTDLRERIEYSYDANTGQKSIERTLAFENGSWFEKQRESFTYDSLRQLQTITHEDGTTIHYAYDSEGRVASVRDENHANANTLYEYDPAGRLAAVRQTLSTAPGGFITTSYQYDLHGNLISVVDPNGNITSYVFDDFGRMVSQQSPVTGTTEYAYDEAGNLKSTTDARGAFMERRYDALNRIISAVSSLDGSSETVTWAYDDPSAGRFTIGRLALMTDPAGSTSYHYERRGLLRRESRAYVNQPAQPPTGDGDGRGFSLGTSSDDRLPAAAWAATTSFTYDVDGNRNSIAYPSGQLTVNYVFDYAGRPVSASGFITSASYLPFGPLTQLRFANGTTQSMAYDTRYRMTTNELTLDGVPPGQARIARYNYAYDPAGNMVSLLDATDSAYHRHLVYDDLNRLIEANTKPETPNNPSALWNKGKYRWDAMGNILSASLAEVEPGGPDELSATHPKRFQPPNKPRKKNEAIVQPLGRTMQFAYSGTTPILTGVTLNDLSRGVTHDAAGNETSYVVTRTYSPRNLLQKVTDAAEPEEQFIHTLAYGYDGRGVRISRAESPSNGFGTTARRYYVYTPELTLLAASRDDSPNVWGGSPPSGLANNIDYEIVWFGNRPVAQVSEPSGARTYTFADHLGTPILQTDQSRTVTWRVEYEPFGNVYEVRAGTRTDQPLRFPGQDVAMTWEGPEENYNIFRWYKGGWGRYTSPDPLGLAAGMNLYAYVDANPVNYSDPLGLIKPVHPSKQKYRPCNNDEIQKCQASCKYGMESCMVSQTFKIIKMTGGKTLYGWVDGPMSCSCKEPSCWEQLKEWADPKKWFDPNPTPPLPPFVPIPPKLPTPKPVIPGLPPFFVNPCMLNPSLCYGDTGIA